MAERSGVAVSALHFYEAQGLISSRRTAGNQRRYPREVIRRVAFIRASQGVGIPLAPDQGRARPAAGPSHAHPPGLGAPVGAWRGELDDQISRLQRLRDNLSGCIGCGCLSLDLCKLVNPGDILGGQGPGTKKAVTSVESSHGPFGITILIFADGRPMRNGADAQSVG